MTPARALRAAFPAAPSALIRAAIHGAICAALAALPLAGCAVVKPYEREKLADPIMDPESPVGKQTLERKFQSTREGGSGGGTGSGGGCGCAK